MQVAHAKGARAGINVTPLIDIVLVLLIIFMVLTPTAMKHMTATVPRPSQDQQLDRGLPPITVEYRQDGQIALNQQPVAFAALASEVANRLRFDRSKVVFFQVDDGCDYGEVIKLMDTVRGAGAKTLGIVTGQPPRNP